MTEPVYIASCPVHGPHGTRLRCFVCNEPVERVAMIPVEEHETAKRKWVEANRLLVADLARLRDAASWLLRCQDDIIAGKPVRGFFTTYCSSKIRARWTTES